jgi:hypothetical protein
MTTWPKLPPEPPSEQKADPLSTWSCAGLRSPPKSGEENQLEVSFLGFQAKAKGPLGVIVLALLLVIWMGLKAFHLF